MSDGSEKILGIHHVTAIATDPQRNLDFYAGLLGLRLVKKTVNFDDPGTYHFYFGDEVGRPGTVLTFFPWPGARRGSRGTGQATVTSFSVPEGSLPYWADRLGAAGVTHDDPARRFDEEVLTLLDPDGLKLELVAHGGAAEREARADGPVPAERALRGFFGVTLSERDVEATAALLADMGFAPGADGGGRFRFAAGVEGPGSRVDVLVSPDGSPGRVAAGTVHHVAWRAADDGVQVAWRERLLGRSLDPTPVLDRRYFHSIYFREPGGVLFEIATDGPGFTLDEPVESLGRALRLPPWLEGQRRRIEEVLPEVRVPEVAEPAAP